MRQRSILAGVRTFVRHARVVEQRPEYDIIKRSLTSAMNPYSLMNQYLPVLFVQTCHVVACNPALLDATLAPLEDNGNIAAEAEHMPTDARRAKDALALLCRELRRRRTRLPRAGDERPRPVGSRRGLLGGRTMCDRSEERPVRVGQEPVSSPQSWSSSRIVLQIISENRRSKSIIASGLRDRTQEVPT